MALNNMNIVFSINEQFIPYTYITLTSLFENNKEECIHVYILHKKAKNSKAWHVFDELEKKYAQIISCIEVEPAVFGDKLPHTNYWPMEIYYRCGLSELLPNEVERVLYLDADIIISNNIHDFYFMDLHGKSIGACKDMGILTGAAPLDQKRLELFHPFLEDDAYFYFNSGVLLMDIAKMRMEGKDTAYFVKTGESILDYLKGDQDILNYVFHHDVVYGDEKRYNVCAYVAYNRMGWDYEWVKKHCAIIHFTGAKPWHPDAFRYNIEKIFWDYAKMTPYYYDLLEQLLMGELESQYLRGIVYHLQEENMQLHSTLRDCKALLEKLNK